MTNLEDHLVWVFSLAKAKSCPEILLKELSVSVLLQGLHQALVHGLLVSLPLLAGLVGLLLGLENVSVLERKDWIEIFPKLRNSIDVGHYKIRVSFHLQVCVRRQFLLFYGFIILVGIWGKQCKENIR